MIDKKELEKSLTYLSKKSPVSKDQPNSGSIRYNSDGDSDKGKKKKFSDDETAAISIPTDRGVIFKIKTQRGGHFYNPLKEGSTVDYSLAKKDKTTKESKFSFQEVNYQAFAKYIKFLSTKYDSYLIAAEREV